MYLNKSAFECSFKNKLIYLSIYKVTKKEEFNYKSEEKKGEGNAQTECPNPRNPTVGSGGTMSVLKVLEEW